MGAHRLIGGETTRSHVAGRKFGGGCRGSTACNQGDRVRAIGSRMGSLLLSGRGGPVSGPVGAEVRVESGHICANWSANQGQIDRDRKSRPAPGPERHQGVDARSPRRKN